MSFQQISESEIRAQVIEFMSSLKIEPYDENLILDGELRRFRTKGDRAGEYSGAYCIHTDGLPAGFVMDWRTGAKSIWRFDTHSLSQEQREYISSPEFKEKADRHRLQREKELAERHKRAAEYSRVLFDHLKPAPENNPYLKRKKVYPYNINVQDDTLVVPLRDIDGKLKSLQWIYPDGTKRFQPDTSIDGAFWSIALDTVKPNDSGIIFLGEGFATMAKVHELTGKASVAAITCHALKDVAQKLQEKYPESRIIIMADDDKGTEQKRGINPGIEAAKSAVEAGYAEMYISPPFEKPEDGTDWDDYAVKYGNEAAMSEIDAQIARIMREQKQAKYRSEAEKLGFMSGEKFSKFCEPSGSNDYLIQGWLPSESLMMLFAPSGSGKGFIALDIAFSVACNAVEDWHGQKVLKHGSVVYLAGEGQRGMKKRCAGLTAYKGINPEEVGITIIRDAIAIDDKQPELGVRRVIANIGMYCPDPVLILLDTTNCYMSGDENKTVDATAFIRACKEIKQEFNCSVMPVHHTGQNPEVQTRARGSSAFKAAMDMEYRLTKSGRILTLEMTKSKDTDLQKALMFNMLEVDAPGFYNALGEQETTCVLERNEGISIPNNEILKPSLRSTKGEEFARETYREAARKYGKIVHDEELCKGVVTVRAEDWRSEFYRLCSAEKDNAKRARYSEARRILIEDKKLLFMKEVDGVSYICITPNGEAYEIGIVLSISRREKNESTKE